jgi:NitT/TauT family transport system substrate-binding protein
MSTRLSRLVAALLGAVLAIAAPVSAQGPKPMRLTLNFLAGAPQAGFMYAKSLGYYKDAGIDLTIEEGKGSASTAQRVADGKTDVGLADAPAAMQFRSKGAPVKIVAPVLQTNGFAIITIDGSGINAPKDLVGKRLGVQPGATQTALLEAILTANGIDRAKLQIVNLDAAALAGALLEHKVDAIVASADFQSVQIRDRGFKVKDILYRDVGVPTVGLSIIARDDRLTADADLYRRFVAASLRGWDEARRNPAAAAAAVVEQFPAVNKDRIVKELKVDLDLVCAPGATALGRVPERNWQLTFDLLATYLGLPRKKPVTDYYTTEFQPADAPACP